MLNLLCRSANAKCATRLPISLVGKGRKVDASSIAVSSWSISRTTSCAFCEVASKATASSSNERSSGVIRSANARSRARPPP